MWSPIGVWNVDILHFLDNGGEVVSLKRRPRFNPQEESWYLFMLEAEPTPGSYD
jgi:hypothetical protein